MKTHLKCIALPHFSPPQPAERNEQHTHTRWNFSGFDGLLARLTSLENTQISCTSEAQKCSRHCNVTICLALHAKILHRQRKKLKMYMIGTEKERLNEWLEGNEKSKTFANKKKLNWLEDEYWVGKFQMISDKSGLDGYFHSIFGGVISFVVDFGVFFPPPPNLIFYFTIGKATDVPLADFDVPCIVGWNTQLFFYEKLPIYCDWSSRERASDFPLSLISSCQVFGDVIYRNRILALSRSWIEWRRFLRSHFVSFSHRTMKSNFGIFFYVLRDDDFRESLAMWAWRQG